MAAGARLFVAAALLLVSAGARAAEPDLRIAPQATFEPVFLHARDACAESDIPDTPARAWRDAQGAVHLIATHHTNRRMNGPDLDHLRVACATVYQGARGRDPAAYDDWDWIAAPYTLDGRTVFALVHSEFHGQARPDLCPAAHYPECWRNSVTLALSQDGGATFHLQPREARLVAGLPYPFPGTLGRRSGYFSPSNIVARDGFYYAFVWAEPYEAQRRGACLLRTATLDQAGSWRAYDGKDFSVAFVDPYRQTVDDPARHVCAPVAPRQIGSTLWSVVRHEASGRWIAVTAAERAETPGAPPSAGIWWSSSPDLLAWSEPRLVAKLPLLTRPDCMMKVAYYYPALLDPKSPDRNFETVGARAYLYLTRLTLTNCRPTWSRDLVRIPVDVTAAN